MTAGKDLDPVLLIPVFGVALEVVLSLVLAQYLWRKTGSSRVRRLPRVLIMATVIALLFSPTFAACGALAPLPFPVIVAMDLYFPPSECGNLAHLTAFNLKYVVIPTWVVAVAIFSFRTRKTAPSAL